MQPKIKERARLEARIVERLCGHDRSTLQRWADAGQFPKPHRLGFGRFAKRFWYADEVTDWLDEQLKNQGARNVSA